MARTCTWDGGGGTALASLNTNWDTDVAPVAGDSIVFPTTTKSCTWDLNLSLVTFTVNSGYVQTITQSSGANLTFSGAFAVNGACTIALSGTATLSCAGFSMSTGTLNCGGGSFTCTTFALTNAAIFTGSSSAISTTAVTYANTSAITATSGTWTLAGSWTRSNTATFTHNSGTIAITANSTITDTGATFNKFTINTVDVGVTVAASTTMPLGATPSTVVGTAALTISGVLTFSGLWTHNGSITTNNGSTITGTSTPTMNVNRTFTINATTTITNAIGTITVATGTAGTTVTDTGDAFSGSTWVVSKSGNQAFTVAASTTVRLGASPTSSVGTSTLTVTGTLTYSGTWTHTGSLTTSASSVVTGSSTPALVINQSLTISATATTWTSVNITKNGATATTYTDTGAKNSGTWTLNSTTSSSTVTIAASTSMALGASPTVICSTVTVTGTLTGTGTLTYDTSTIGGVVFTVGATGTVSGFSGFIIYSSLTVTSGGVFPTVPITFTGSVSSSTITGTANTFGTVTVSKTAIGMTVAASTTCPLGTAPTSLTSTLTINGTVTFAGTWDLQADLTVASGATLTGTSTPVIMVTNGSPNINSGSTLTNPVSITMTQTLGTSRTFTGGGKTYTNFLRNGSGTGTTIIASSNTFTTFTDNAGLAAHTLQFTSTTTQTATTFQLGGTAANLLTINATSNGSAAILHQTGPNQIVARYTSIKDSTVDVTPKWYAGNGSTLVSGNTNWELGEPVGGGFGGRNRRRKMRQTA